jgi:hypothetical protein
MQPLEARWINSLVKILPGQDLSDGPDTGSGTWTALRGERTAVQLALRWHWTPEAGRARAVARLRIRSLLADQIQVFRVIEVPVRLPAYPDHDADILTDTPGLIPDLLRELTPEHDAAGPFRRVYLPVGQWQVYWIELIVPDTAGGLVSITAELSLEQAGSGEPTVLAQTALEVVPVALPAQTLHRTEWFHADCLADYYQVSVFSEAHWQIIDAFVRLAVLHGVNMLLTPLFTPPLDTAVGGERTTVQLVDVWCERGVWRFGFERLGRWVDLALAAGIRTFELSHLYTQWGAKAAPKIMAAVDGQVRQVFGWDTPATGAAYRDFLAAFLPELVTWLYRRGLDGRCWFHVSDEPSLGDLASYRAAKAQIKPWIGDFPIIDALSDFAFYETGAVDKPIPATNHLEPFLQAGVPDLWAYYCCGQYKGVSNLFMAMPSARNRIIGVQFYLLGITGFLHWGYNFYNSQYSLAALNPYLFTDADGAFPAGDAFLVYPGPDGRPEASVRLKVFAQALSDLAALQLLEQLTSRETVVDLIQDQIAEPISLTNYPRRAGWLLDLRARINRAIRERM